MDSAAATPGPGTGTLPLFGGVLRSEARKLHTVRSTWFALLAGFAFTVVTAALLGALLPAHLSLHQKATIDSVRHPDPRYKTRTMASLRRCHLPRARRPASR
jgi:hypothetical protein